MPKQYFGWKRQDSDKRTVERDWVYVIPREILAALPVSYDLTSSMKDKLDQGSLGSCGPNTAAECIQCDQGLENLPVVLPSRLFIYWVTRYLMGTTNQDSGVDNRTMLKALAGYGYCPETLWLPNGAGYDIRQFTRQPSKDCFQAAQANRITSYAAVTKTLDQMKGTNVTGFPFIFGFDVYQQIEGDEAAATGIIRDPSPGATPVGGHDMSLVGYDDQGFGIPYFSGKGAFKLKQHWAGPNDGWWGDNGYGYISYAYATGLHASDFWVVNSVEGVIPRPPKPIPPDPTPVPTPIPPIPPIPPDPTPLPPNPNPIPPSPIVPPAGLVDFLQWLATQPWFQDFLIWLSNRFKGQMPKDEFQWRSRVIQYIHEYNQNLIPQ